MKRNEIEKRYINVMCHPSDEGTLVIGEEKVALIDCGMAFCAPEKIEKLKSLLGGRAIDYIIAGHSHYDHIGSIPHMKKVWKDLKVISSEYAATVFTKPGALKTIRELSVTAAKTYRPDDAKLPEYVNDYDDAAFHTDIIVHEGDKIELGGITLEVIATPGHTRDAISFYVPEWRLIKVDETLGVLTSETTMYPVYLVSYLLACEAIEKCAKYDAEYISSPHYGLVSDEVARGYFKLAMDTINECRDLLLKGYYEGKSEEELVEVFAARYRNENLVDKQPYEAFMLNTVVTIRTTIKECAEPKEQA